MKSVHIRSFSGLYFHSFRLKTERYGVSLRIQSECGKIQTSKTPKRTLFTQYTCSIIMLVTTKKILRGNPAHYIEKITELLPQYILLRYDYTSETWNSGNLSHL